VFVLGPVLLAGAICYTVGAISSSNFLAIALLSLGLTFGCITLVLGPAILMELVSKKQGRNLPIPALISKMLKMSVVNLFEVLLVL